MGNEESDLDFGTYVHRTGMDVESGLQTVDGPCDHTLRTDGILDARQSSCFSVHHRGSSHPSLKEASGFSPMAS